MVSCNACNVLRVEMGRRGGGIRNTGRESMLRYEVGYSELTLYIHVITRGVAMFLARVYPEVTQNSHSTRHHTGLP